MKNEDLARLLADRHPGLKFDAVVIDANVNAADECLRGLIYLDTRGRFLDGEILCTSPIDHVEAGGRIMVTQTGTRYLVALDAETELLRREASIDPADHARYMLAGALADDDGAPKLTIDFPALVVSAVSTGPFSIGSPVVNGLSKLIEEAGEVIQVAGKVIALGGFGQHYDGSDLGERFDEELADLLAAIDFVIVKNGRNKAAIDARRIGKRARFEEWNADARVAA